MTARRDSYTEAASGGGIGRGWQELHNVIDGVFQGRHKTQRFGAAAMAGENSSGQYRTASALAVLTQVLSLAPAIHKAAILVTLRQNVASDLLQPQTSAAYCRLLCRCS